MFYKIDQPTLNSAFTLIRKSAHPSFPFEQVESVVVALQSLKRIEENKNEKKEDATKAEPKAKPEKK